MDEKTINTHKILFSRGDLFLDGVKIAGNGITPEKDVLFEFAVKDRIIHKKIEIPVIQKDPSILEVCVFDSVNSKDVGPGQKG